jgi:flagella basal body P-ring formation protein FlgA
MKKLIKIVLAIILLVGAVSTQAAQLPPEKAATMRLAEMFNLNEDVYRIEVLSQHLNTALIDPADLILRPLTQKEPLGRYTVKAVVYENGIEVESGQIRFNIRKSADVLVTTEKARSRHKIGENQVAIKRMDVTNLRETPLTSVDALIGHRARRNIKSGKILTQESIELIPDIEPGREVTIVYVDGFCRVTSKGMAMQRGMVGDYVKVKNKASGKTVIARVVDAAAVAIDP